MQEHPRTWNGFWAEFWRIRHLRTIPGIDDWNRKLVDHIIHVLSLQPGSRVLDLACGSGEHAIELARRGMIPTGIDIAPVLVEYATAGADKEGLSSQFRVGDMRDFDFQHEFDAVTILSGSFGFFDDDGNLGVLEQMARAMKPGGQVYIQVPNPEQQKPGRTRSWAAVDGGFVLWEESFNSESRRRSGTFKYITPDGDLITFASESEDTSVSDSMKIYTLEGYKAMFARAGLDFTSAYGSIDLPPQLFGTDSQEMIVCGAKS